MCLGVGVHSEKWVQTPDPKGKDTLWFFLSRDDHWILTHHPYSNLGPGMPLTTYLDFFCHSFECKIFPGPSFQHLCLRVAVPIAPCPMLRNSLLIYLPPDTMSTSFLALSHLHTASSHSIMKQVMLPYVIKSKMQSTVTYTIIFCTTKK